jgi:S-adenosylmethionine:tRNA ribosyltransferase-isomerase
VDPADFEYVLPPGAIAQAPAPSREGARLLVIDRAGQALEDRTIGDLPDLLHPGDCVVVNDSRVIPARVIAEDAKRRPVELLFLEPDDETDARWTALVRPGRRCPVGAELQAGESVLRVVALAADGARIIERVGGTITGLLEDRGMIPLPPYISRPAAPSSQDHERYQTVYARQPGSVAAPTAGLHFGPELLDQLRAREIEVHALTLHVGAATFRPIRAARVEDHALPSERVTIPSSTAAAITSARATGRRVVAVGTTTTRALESVATADGQVAPYEGRVGIFITPGHRFRVVDALLTNFHLPRSSLLVLVSAFAGRDLVLKAYRHAVDADYRFYSYGDATLIV